MTVINFTIREPSSGSSLNLSVFGLRWVGDTIWSAGNQFSMMVALPGKHSKKATQMTRFNMSVVSIKISVSSHRLTFTGKI